MLDHDLLIVIEAKSTAWLLLRKRTNALYDK